MEPYKHSCPFCGQHIEYTDEQCGQKTTCPSCGTPVTFPAIPPGGRRKPLQIKKAAAMRGRKGKFDLPAIMAALREFEHWNVVWSGVVPFLVVAALVIGAIIVKKKLGDSPAITAAPLVQATADPNAWQQMTNVAQAEISVQEQLAQVNQANAVVIVARQNSAALDAKYRGVVIDRNSVYNMTRERQAAAQAQMSADARLVSAKRSFEGAFLYYQKMGGTIDYRRQLPQ